MPLVFEFQLILPKDNQTTLIQVAEVCKNPLTISTKLKANGWMLFKFLLNFTRWSELSLTLFGMAFLRKKYTVKLRVLTHVTNQ